MSDSFSPMQIIWCLTYWTCAEPEQELGHAHFNSAAGTDTLMWMTREGLITADGKPTDRLEAFVRFICATPLPVSQWVRP
jgi:hypothetical protein